MLWCFCSSMADRSSEVWTRAYRKCFYYTTEEDSNIHYQQKKWKLTSTEVYKINLHKLQAGQKRITRTCHLMRFTCVWLDWWHVTWSASVDEGLFIVIYNTALLIQFCNYWFKCKSSGVSCSVLFSLLSRELLGGFIMCLCGHASPCRLHRACRCKRFILKRLNCLSGSHVNALTVFRRFLKEDWYAECFLRNLNVIFI